MKDNSTGKDKEFYELGKKMFDRLNPPGTPPFKPYVSKREWVGLTDDEINEIYEQAETLVHDSWVGKVGLMFPITLCKMFEDKLKEKNNG